MLTNEADTITYIFRSLRRMRGQMRGPDEVSRTTRPTRQLIERLNLLAQRREYAVVTGSKGKGSTTIITARLLQALGHTVGTITSPHLVSWRERIRVNGRAIPEADLVRITNELTPAIDAIEATLTDEQYFSPQGIFLAVALRWFDEQGVTAAVLEVGRGGRFDDISLVPNKLALFTPIMLEHVQQLGPTLERIAWHKAGIIQEGGYAYSVPQAPEVMAVLAREAERHQAQFDWIAPLDMAQYIGPAPGGQRAHMGRYGEVVLSLRGRYQLQNALLAVIGAGNMHARLTSPISHSSAEYVARIQAGLASVVWPGRCQQLQQDPPVFLDGAINRESASSFVESVRDALVDPVISIIGVPDDKDYAGVYAELGAVSEALILTETERNPSLHFLESAEAVARASAYSRDVTYAPHLRAAVDLARERAGTILIAGTQSLVADAIQLWGYSYEVL